MIKSSSAASFALSVKGGVVVDRFSKLSCVMVDSKRDLKFCVSTKGDGFPLFNVFKGDFKGDFSGDFRGARSWRVG